jgi:hypothetical protein
MDGVVTSYIAGSTPQSFREQVWIEQARPKFRVLVSGVDMISTESIKTCDGTNVVETNLITGQSQTSHIQTAPGRQLPILAGSATGNPIWGQITISRRWHHPILHKMLAPSSRLGSTAWPGARPDHGMDLARPANRPNFGWTHSRHIKAVLCGNQAAGRSNERVGG